MCVYTYIYIYAHIFRGILGQHLGSGFRKYTSQISTWLWGRYCEDSLAHSPGMVVQGDTDPRAGKLAIVLSRFTDILNPNKNILARTLLVPLDRGVWSLIVGILGF